MEPVTVAVLDVGCGAGAGAGAGAGDVVAVVASVAVGAEADADIDALAEEGVAPMSCAEAGPAPSAAANATPRLSPTMAKEVFDRRSTDGGRWRRGAAFTEAETHDIVDPTSYSWCARTAIDHAAFGAFLCRAARVPGWGCVSGLLPRSHHGTKVREMPRVLGGDGVEEGATARGEGGSSPGAASTEAAGTSEASAGTFAEVFGIDPRALGLFRVAFGLALWMDLADRFRLRRLLFSNEGVLPNFALSQKAAPGVSLSIYTAFSSPAEVTFAFALTAIVYAFYTLGWFTRASQVLALVCVTSLAARNPVASTLSDSVVCALAAFSVFLPLGRRFSVDAVRKSLAERREIAMHALEPAARVDSADAELTAPFVSVAGLGLALQLGVWFLGAAAADFFPRADAGGGGGPPLHWALFHDSFATRLGGLIRSHAVLVSGAGWKLTIASLLALFAWFSPRRAVNVRVAGMAGAFLVAVGLGAVFCVGPLPFALIAGALLASPTRALDALGTRLARGVAEVTVVAPAADAGLLWACRVLSRLDGYAKLRFVDREDEARLPDGYTKTDFAVYEKGVWATGPEALAVALRALPGGGGWSFLAKMPPFSWLIGVLFDPARRARLEASYGLPHGHRGAFAGLGLPEADGEGNLPERPVREGEDVFVDDPPTPLALWIEGKLVAVREVGAGVLTLLVLLAAFHATPVLAESAPRVAVPARLAWVLSYLQITENIGFLYDFHDHEAGALVVDLHLADGTSIDPLTGAAPNRRVLLEGRFGENALWTAYTRALRAPQNTVYRDDLRRVLRTFARRGSRVARVTGGEIVWVRRPSPAPDTPGTLPQTIEEEVLFENR